jgi:hypothetical protein
MKSIAGPTRTLCDKSSLQFMCIKVTGKNFVYANFKRADGQWSNMRSERSASFIFAGPPRWKNELALECSIAPIGLGVHLRLGEPPQRPQLARKLLNWQLGRN